MLHSPGSQEAFPTLPARWVFVLLLRHPYRNFEEASYLYQEDQEKAQRSLGLQVASVPEAFSGDPDWQGLVAALEDRRTRRAAWVSDLLLEPGHDAP